MRIWAASNVRRRRSSRRSGSWRQDGVTEVMLLGQNVNSYGRGLPQEISFAELLRQVEAVSRESEGSVL